MAYIIGILTPEEETALEKRGWELEEVPDDFVQSVYPGKRLRMVWVDADMFDIMSGPDWETGDKKKL